MCACTFKTDVDISRMMECAKSATRWSGNGFHTSTTTTNCKKSSTSVWNTRWRNCRWARAASATFQADCWTTFICSRDFTCGETSSRQYRTGCSGAPRDWPNCCCGATTSTSSMRPLSTVFAACGDSISTGTGWRCCQRPPWLVLRRCGHSGLPTTESTPWRPIHSPRCPDSAPSVSTETASRTSTRARSTASATSPCWRSTETPCTSFPMTSSSIFGVWRNYICRTITSSTSGQGRFAACARCTDCDWRSTDSGTCQTAFSATLRRSDTSNWTETVCKWSAVAPWRRPWSTNRAGRDELALLCCWMQIRCVAIAGCRGCWTSSAAENSECLEHAGLTQWHRHPGMSWPFCGTWQNHANIPIPWRTASIVAIVPPDSFDANYM